MRIKHEYVVITFNNTTEAMAMEKYCSEQLLPGRMIPVPQEISAGCGLAWRVKKEDYIFLDERYAEWEIWSAEIREIKM